MNTLETPPRGIRSRPISSWRSLISWSGVFLVIGGLAGIPGTKQETDRLFPFAYLAMLAGPSLAGILSILLTEGKPDFPELWSRAGPMARRRSLVRRRVPHRTRPDHDGSALVVSALPRLRARQSSRPRTEKPLLLFGLIVVAWGQAFSRNWAGRDSRFRDSGDVTACSPAGLFSRGDVGRVAHPGEPLGQRNAQRARSPRSSCCRCCSRR